MRDLTAEMVAELAKPLVRPVYFFEALFDPPLRLFTGYGTFDWDGKTWTGSGGLLNVTLAEETQALRATAATFTLNLFDPALIALLGNTRVNGTPVNVWYGYLDENEAVVPDPELQFSGTLEQPQTNDAGDSGQITVAGESDLAVLFRNRGRRYTDKDQQIEFPGDTGLRYVTDQARAIVWKG